MSIKPTSNRNDILRVRILSHSWVLPVTELLWYVRRVLRTLDTVAIECWYAYVSTAWGLCLLWPGRPLFDIAPTIFDTMKALGNEEWWGLAALGTAVFPLTALVLGLRRQYAINAQQEPPPVTITLHVGGRALETDPRTVGPFLAAIFYGALAGSLAVQSFRLPGVWIWGGFAGVCLFVYWRRLVR